MVGKFARRVDRLLTLKRARTYALFVLAIYLTAWLYVSLRGQPPLNTAGEPIGGDYIAFYAAGLMVRTGDATHLYDRSAVQAVQARLLSNHAPGFYDPLRNPPFLALLFVPLSLLDLLPSFGIWSLISLTCLLVALRVSLDEVPAVRRRWRSLLVLALAFAPVYFNLVDGENSAVSLLLYVLIYRALVRGQDRAAGIWAALGLFKPQLFIVFPLLFLATVRWRAVLAYAVTALALAAVSFATVGAEGTLGWLRILVDLEPRNATSLSWRMHSLKAFFDLFLPAEPALAWALYGVTALLVLAVLVVVWRRAPRLPPAVWALTVVGAVLVDPHLVEYDLSVLIAVGPLALSLVPAARWLAVLFYALTLARSQVPLGESSIQLTTLVLTALAALLWRNLSPIEAVTPSLSTARCR